MGARGRGLPSEEIRRRGGISFPRAGVGWFEEATLPVSLYKEASATMQRRTLRVEGSLLSLGATLERRRISTRPPLRPGPKEVAPALRGLSSAADSALRVCSGGGCVSRGLIGFERSRVAVGSASALHFAAPRPSALRRGGVCASVKEFQGNSQEAAETEQGAAASAEAASVFDHIYRHVVSLKAKPPRHGAASPQGSGLALGQGAALTLATEDGLASEACVLVLPEASFPNSKTQDPPSVLLLRLRDLVRAGVRTPQAWEPELLQILQQLPRLRSSDIAQAALLLAEAQCRPVLVMQGLSEALRWRSKEGVACPRDLVCFLDAMRRLRCVHHAARQWNWI